MRKKYQYKGYLVTEERANDHLTDFYIVKYPECNKRFSLHDNQLEAKNII